MIGLSGHCPLTLDIDGVLHVVAGGHHEGVTGGRAGDHLQQDVEQDVLVIQALKKWKCSVLSALSNGVFRSSLRRLVLK